MAAPRTLFMFTTVVSFTPAAFALSDARVYRYHTKEEAQQEREALEVEHLRQQRTLELSGVRNHKKIIVSPVIEICLPDVSKTRASTTGE